MEIELIYIFIYDFTTPTELQAMNESKYLDIWEKGTLLIKPKIYCNLFYNVLKPSEKINKISYHSNIDMHTQ